MNSKEIVISNSTGADKTFLGELHERSTWDDVLFLALIDAINDLADTPDQSTLVLQVNKINSYILNSIINHFNPNDVLEIASFNEEIITDYLERLNLVVEGFFSRNPVSEDIFDDDLRSL